MYKQYRPRIKSRHPSHGVLRPRHKKLPLLPFKSVIRFGSSTAINDTIDNGGDRVELNSVNSIKNSSNKLLMKQCFTENNVKTADWWLYLEDDTFNKQVNGENELTHITELPYPIIAKSKFGSRGRGNYKLNSVEELQDWISKKDTSNYIFEKFYNYNKEYRLHVDKNKCFYTCRKMLRRDTPENSRWFRNDSNSVWVLENNNDFDKPVNWDNIVTECIKSLNAVGLDFGAIDLRIQNSINGKGNNRENPKFIVIEINSAPSFGTITSEKYIEFLPEILKNKYNETTN